ncbi:MAG: 50S ribosomal protein L30 [Thermoproteota archaeon]|jgi:large subunit ribosomal protein L30|nr:50S ribosomal protein L30 [Thermoproteota archaeon]
MAYIVLRIKGTVNVPHWARYTLNNLSLHKKFSATIVPETPDSLGMLRKIKDFVAWSHADSSFLIELLEKRGKTIGSKPLKSSMNSGPYSDLSSLASDLAEDKIRLSNLQTVKPWFALNPPRGGFKRKTKTQFHQKGVLGEDKELVEIMKRMI